MPKRKLLVTTEKKKTKLANKLQKTITVALKRINCEANDNPVGICP